MTALWAIAVSTTPPTWAGIITAVSTLVVAIGGFISAFTLLLPLLRSSRAVHGLVNGQRTDALRYQAALIKALRSAGVEVPEDQSIIDDAIFLPPPAPPRAEASRPTRKRAAP